CSVGCNFRICAVLIRPGATVLTVKAYAPTSDANVLDQLGSAALDGGAAFSFGAMRAPEIVMTRPQPCAFIAGITRSVRRRAAIKFRVNDSSQKSSSASPLIGLAPPALLTRMS